MSDRETDAPMAKVFWRGLCVTWSMAHKLIQHLRRQGWTVDSMPRGPDYISFWCSTDGDYFCISLWREGMACIENPDYDFRDDGDNGGLDTAFRAAHEERWRHFN